MEQLGKAEKNKFTQKIQQQQKKNAHLALCLWHFTKTAATTTTNIGVLEGRANTCLLWWNNWLHFFPVKMSGAGAIKYLLGLIQFSVWKRGQNHNWTHRFASVGITSGWYSSCLKTNDADCPSSGEPLPVLISHRPKTNVCVCLQWNGMDGLVISRVPRQTAHTCESVPLIACRNWTMLCSRIKCTKNVQWLTSRSETSWDESYSRSANFTYFPYDTSTRVLLI